MIYQTCVKILLPLCLYIYSRSSYKRPTKGGVGCLSREVFFFSLLCWIAWCGGVYSCKVNGDCNSLTPGFYLLRCLAVDFIMHELGLIHSYFSLSRLVVVFPVLDCLHDCLFYHITVLNKLRLYSRFCKVFTSN